MRRCAVHLVGALLCGACGPKSPDDPDGASDAAGSTIGGDADGDSGGTAEPTTAGAGCVDAEVLDADDCARVIDRNYCGPGCRWFDSMLFPDCSGACGDAVSSGVCVAIETVEESGCLGPCAKFWRELPEGLQVVVVDDLMCFEFPVGWEYCGADGPSECGCGCVPPS